MFVSVNDFGCGGCNKAGLPYKDDKPESNADTAFKANSFTRAIVSMQRWKQTPAKILQGFVFAWVCQCSEILSAFKRRGFLFIQLQRFIVFYYL